MRGKPVGIATCGGGGLPCGLVLPACEVAQPEGVAVGRDSVLIPDAHLLRATNSVCCHSGVPTPQTKDLNSVIVAKTDASPTAKSGRYGWRTQPKNRQKLRWSQHRSGNQGAGKDCSKPPSSSSPPSLAHQAPSLPLLSPSSVMRSGAFLRVEIQK